MWEIDIYLQVSLLHCLLNSTVVLCESANGEKHQKETLISIFGCFGFFFLLSINTLSCGFVECGIIINLLNWNCVRIIYRENTKWVRDGEPHRTQFFYVPSFGTHLYTLVGKFIANKMICIDHFVIVRLFVQRHWPTIFMARRNDSTKWPHHQSHKKQN